MLKRLFSTSVDSKEVHKFSKMASEWWHPEGPFKQLHLMNPARVKFIRNHYPTSSQIKPFSNLNILDIGCGGGILSQSLATLGAKVTAIDASEENIKVAEYQAGQNPMLQSNQIQFQNQTAESLVASGNQYDAVCALEVIEHVSDPKFFLQTCSQLLKPNGYLFVSTLNKTFISYFFSIFMAEYVLKMVPVQTHDFQKYIEPEILKKMISDVGLQTVQVNGLIYNPILEKWNLSEASPLQLQMNYIMSARKATFESE